MNTMTVAQHQTSLIEINANIAICSPNDFGKFPYGKDVLNVWLALQAEHTTAMHKAAMTENKSTCNHGFIPAKYPFCNIAEHNKYTYGL